MEEDNTEEKKHSVHFGESCGDDDTECNVKRFSELCHHHNFTEGDFVKHVAIYYNGFQAMNSLYTLKNILPCKQWSVQRLPDGIFGWNMEDCLQRRKLDMFWFRRLLHNFQEHCLESEKFNKDLEEVKNIILSISQVYLHRNSLEEIMKVLQSSLDYLVYEETLIKQYDLNKALYYSKQAVHFIDYATGRLRRRVSETVGSMTKCNYKFRYQLQYEMARFNQTKMKIEKPEEDLRQEIRKYERMYVQEEYCSEQSLQFYYEENEALSNRLLSMTTFYDAQESNIVHENESLRRAISRMKDKQKFYKEEIERFEYEIYCVQNNIKIVRQSVYPNRRSTSKSRIYSIT